MPLFSIRSSQRSKPELLVHGAAAAAAGVPLIKRFTGGGTVVVDADTVFTSLIMSQVQSSQLLT